jgi:hypothetical protein
LLDPNAPPILPDPLPSSLAKEHTNDSLSHLQDEEDDTPLELQNIIPGPTFDASELEKEERARFYRNLHAVTAVLSGEKIRQVAMTYEMAPATLSRLV